MATSKAMQEWEKKYAAQIKGLAEANKVDLSTASSMLQKNLTGGGQYKGGGTISSVQAAAELASAQKAGRDQASASAKRAAASMGAPTVAQTPTMDTVYGDYLTTLQSQAEAQRQAEERAAQLRTQQAVSQVEGYIPQIQQQTAKQMQEAYIAAQRAKMQAPQTLSAMGITGGAAESSLMGIDTDYGNQRNALDLAKNQSLDQIRQNVADIRASGNVELANLAGNYYQQMLANQREAMSQQTAQQRWEAEMAFKQAQAQTEQDRWLQEFALSKQKLAGSPYTGGRDDDKTPYTPSTPTVVTSPSLGAKYANPQDLMAAEMDVTKQIGTNRSRDNIINVIQRMTVSGRISDGIAAILLQRFGVV